VDLGLWPRSDSLLTLTQANLARFKSFGKVLMGGSDCLVARSLAI